MAINACKKDDPIPPVAPSPTADFEFTGGGCTAPCAILFENKSKNGSAYSWDFGDGSTSTESNPTKTYNVGGTYTVKLTATNQIGSGEVSKQVLVQQSAQAQLPTPNFTFTGAGIAPANVSFSNTSSNAVSYNWDFGDGQTSTATNPNHTYTSGGAFSVILTATNDAGSNQITKNVNIAAPPTKVKITKITVIDLPFVNANGSSWDYLNGPDVYYTITDQSDNILMNGSSSRINDVTPANLPLVWTLGTPFEITDFNVGRFIDLWDHDSPDADDYMGWVGFKMSNYTSGSNPYPTTVTNTANSITVKLDLAWE